MEPSVPLSVRASDDQREAVVSTLRARVAEGRLSLDTFSRRVSRAYEARHQEELRDLIRDLPPPGRLTRLLSSATTTLAALADEVSLAWARPRVPVIGLPGHRRAVTLGRSRESDLVINDRAVSRRHARLSRWGDGWVIEDCGSVNGTRVNGLRVVGITPVSSGDTITVGDVHFRIQTRR